MTDPVPVQVTPRPGMTDADVPTLVDLGVMDEPPVPSPEPPQPPPAEA
ncbi:hypothetical protein [Streptomyces phytophilus]|nr:hypothetical protein [Streptomyces phytophilus]